MLKGEIIADGDTGQPIDKEIIYEAIKKYSRLIEIFSEMEKGAIQMTYREYLIQPFTFVIARRIFKNELLEFKSKQK